MIGLISQSCEEGLGTGGGHREKYLPIVCIITVHSQ